MTIALHLRNVSWRDNRLLGQHFFENPLQSEDDEDADEQQKQS
jgi:hypothetical protein